MKLLALDLGSKVAGVAVTKRSIGTNEWIFARSYAWKLPVTSRKDRSRLWCDFMHELSSHDPDVVAYEDVMFASGVDAAHIQGGFKALIQLWCAQNGKIWIPISVAAGKKALGLKSGGKAKQIEAVACAHRLGYTAVSDHNEADAIGIMLAAQKLVKL